MEGLGLGQPMVLDICFGKVRHFRRELFPVKGFQRFNRYPLCVSIPLGSSFVIQPSIYAGWTTETPGHMNFIHSLAVGGIRAGRYVDHQIPFFGFGSGFHTCKHYAATTQLDFRYRINNKNFVTLRTGSFHDEDVINNILKMKPTAYAFGVELGQRSIAGPMLLGFQWCDLTGFSFSLSLGFDF